jgi:hypothetical protein
MQKNVRRKVTFTNSYVEVEVKQSNPYGRDGMAIGSASVEWTSVMTPNVSIGFTSTVGNKPNELIEGRMGMSVDDARQFADAILSVIAGK